MESRETVRKNPAEYTVLAVSTTSTTTILISYEKKVLALSIYTEIYMIITKKIMQENSQNFERKKKEQNI